VLRIRPGDLNRGWRSARADGINPARPEDQFALIGGLNLDYRGDLRWRRLPDRRAPTGCSAAPAGRLPVVRTMTVRAA